MKQRPHTKEALKIAGQGKLYRIEIHLQYIGAFRWTELDSGERWYWEGSSFSERSGLVDVYNVLNDLHKVDISAVMKIGQDGDFKSKKLQKTGVILTFGILLFKDDGSARNLFQTLKPFVCFWFYGI